MTPDRAEVYSAIERSDNKALTYPALERVTDAVMSLFSDEEEES